MAREAGLEFDQAGYEARMKEFREESGKDRKKITITAVKGEMPSTDDSPKYAGHGLFEGAKVLGWVEGDTITRTGSLAPGAQVGLLLDKTPFYAEQGGQIGDRGVITTSTGSFRVEDTQRMGDGVLHWGTVEKGSLAVDQRATCEVDAIRLPIMRHHSTTHMLNWALRKVLGGAIDQKGSLVDGDKTRFDFTFDKPLTAEQIREVELLVNRMIQANTPVLAATMPLAEAKALPGVRAVFGEKYPDPVRVVVMGAQSIAEVTPESSIEFCGGTHLERTGEAGSFRIVSQEAVGKGVRRITAAAGDAALRHGQKMSGLLDEVAAKLNCRPEDLTTRVEALLEENKKLKTQATKSSGADLLGTFDKLLETALTLGSVKVIGGTVPAAPVDQMRVQLDRIRTKAGSCVIAIGWAEEGKVGLMTTVSGDLQDKIEAGKLVGELAPLVGGKGGGPKGMAQAGGKDAEKLPEVYAKLATIVKTKLG